MAIFGKNHNGTMGNGVTHGTSGTHNGRAVPVWTLPIRIFQFIVALIILALCGYARKYFGDYEISNAYGYGIFTGVFVLLVTIYFMVSTCVVAAHHVLVVLILDALCLLFTTILWPFLAGYSGKYKNVSIGAYYGDYFTNYDYTYGVLSGWKAGVAATIFGVLLWISFIVTTFFSLKHGRQNGFKMGKSGKSQSIGMSGASAAPVYGNSNGMGAANTNQSYPVNGGMDNNASMGQAGYNTGPTSHAGGYNAGQEYNGGQNYNAGPMNNNPV